MARYKFSIVLYCISLEKKNSAGGFFKKGHSEVTKT